MVEFVMTVGCSGSGKSTWAHNQEGYEVFDSDRIRGELWGNENDQQNPARVFDIMYRRTCEALSRGQSVVYCATNLGMRYRSHTLSMLKAKFPAVHYRCVVFNTPIEICKEWNDKRAWRGGRGVPAIVIDKQSRQFQFPVQNEEWDEIEIITPAKYNKIAFTNKIWQDVRDFGSQDNPHHTLSLYHHMLATIDKINLSHFSEEESLNLLVAAGTHDIGKAYTRSYDDEGVAHYFGHENLSAYLAMNMYLPQESIQLVNYHMLPFNKQGIPTWKKRLGEELWHKIMVLHDADTRAK